MMECTALSKHIKILLHPIIISLNLAEDLHYCLRTLTDSNEDLSCVLIKIRLLQSNNKKKSHI